MKQLVGSGFRRGLSAGRFAVQVKLGKKADGFGAVTMDGQAISFGPFRLFGERRLLLEGDQQVRLGSPLLTFWPLWSNAPARWSAKSN
jgi:hypothetical protein